MADAATIHATAVLIGAHAVLIRGPSGAGKSRLAFALLKEAECGRLPFARLVADDRVHVTASNGHLLVRPAAPLKGLAEMRGLGIQELPHEPCAVANLVVDLAATDAARLPPEESRQVTIAGVSLARLAVAADADPLPVLLAAIGNGAPPAAAD